jgi:hypothetical protein
MKASAGAATVSITASTCGKGTPNWLLSLAAKSLMSTPAWLLRLSRKLSSPPPVTAGALKRTGRIVAMRIHFILILLNAIIHEPHAATADMAVLLLEL